MWWRRKRVVRRKRSSSVTQHYLAHKEAARQLVHERLAYWSAHYNLPVRRVAIRNTRSRWGSCSEAGNLNFSYKILFLPPHLQDYLIIHELCHVQEFHHGPAFWALVARHYPEYRAARRELRAIERAGSHRTSPSARRSG
ncbi:DUF45 domain-containing protein [Patescibacteria group bacterium]|jgi:predicted metal-dependent hydrolase|nr:DUF45 domain-containing protein [Patescibacteria group bacterium]